MEKEKLIQQLIHNSSQRAVREVGVCILLALVFGTRLFHLRVGGIHYVGCLLLAIIPVFIATVIWKFTLSEKLLHRHPLHDSRFWETAFRSQARLLRLVPYWYLAPLTLGIVLYALPASAAELPSFYGYLLVVALLFGGVAWLNRSAAAKLEEQAGFIGS